jgi:hypothetical protein
MPIALDEFKGRVEAGLQDDYEIPAGQIDFTALGRLGQDMATDPDGSSSVQFVKLVVEAALVDAEEEARRKGWEGNAGTLSKRSLAEYVDKAVAEIIGGEPYREAVTLGAKAALFKAFRNLHPKPHTNEHAGAANTLSL